MSIKQVILGWLSENSLTGYDLKKKFAASEIFHWSGNNNQIYKALVELHTEQLVTVETQQQPNKPPRKIYSITTAGRAALQTWLQATPPLLQVQHPLLMQLTWTDQITADARQTFLTHYANELEAYLVLLREQAQRQQMQNPAAIWATRVTQHWIAFYELEKRWIQELLQEQEEHE